MVLIKKRKKKQLGCLSYCCQMEIFPKFLSIWPKSSWHRETSRYNNISYNNLSHFWWKTSMIFIHPTKKIHNKVKSNNIQYNRIILKNTSSFSVKWITLFWCNNGFSIRTTLYPTLGIVTWRMCYNL